MPRQNRPTVAKFTIRTLKQAHAAGRALAVGLTANGGKPLVVVVTDAGEYAAARRNWRITVRNLRAMKKKWKGLAAKIRVDVERYRTERPKVTGDYYS
jgi:hypothetical protein